MGSIIIALIAFIGGVLLVKNYNKIDTSLFGRNVPDYEPTGRGVIWFAAFAGAIFGVVYLYNQFVDGNPRLNNVYYFTGASILTMVVIAALFTEMIGNGSHSRIIAKCFFLGLCSIIAFVVGLAGSFIVFCVIVLYLLLKITSATISSSGNERVVKTKSGLLGDGGMKLTRVSGDIYESSDGRRFQRDGDQVTEIE